MRRCWGIVRRRGRSEKICKALLGWDSRCLGRGDRAQRAKAGAIDFVVFSGLTWSWRRSTRYPPFTMAKRSTSRPPSLEIASRNNVFLKHEWYSKILRLSPSRRPRAATPRCRTCLMMRPQPSPLVRQRSHPYSKQPPFPFSSSFSLSPFLSPLAFLPPLLPTLKHPQRLHLLEHEL